ncbi:MAG: hypothetical protein SFV55_15505 [Haliscomenobacter sp.]|uniref:hypothetical protein n=1 Tax=Haliscomenobacter sp. TaxID=2717303 RepID=UPI0029BC2136|nr:hypothetical protein [Haliscomenobacter sp.]MDX2069834.1 hypothetical protein [Haliscomenobacter sp.]
MMRYELKHDKLAAQIFVRASAAAKARRRAAEVYVLYTEKNRLLTVEELEDLAPFLPVLSPPPALQQLMERSRDSIREKEAAEKVRLERELKEKQGLLEQAEQQRKRATLFGGVGFVLAAVAIMAGLWAYQGQLKAKASQEETEKTLEALTLEKIQRQEIDLREWQRKKAVFAKGERLDLVEMADDSIRKIELSKQKNQAKLKNPN